MANKEGFNIPISMMVGKNKLINLKSEKDEGLYFCDFTIAELEVWEVIFEKWKLQII